MPGFIKVIDENIKFIFWPLAHETPPGNALYCRGRSKRLNDNTNLTYTYSDLN